MLAHLEVRDANLLSVVDLEDPTVTLLTLRGPKPKPRVSVTDKE